MTVRLVHGDSVAVLQGFAVSSVDMVYCDPPFGNGKVWSGSAGSFDDRWSRVARASASPHLDALIGAFPVSPALKSYLSWAATLIGCIRRVLRPTGSMWLHFDDTAGAYLRLISDFIFGVEHSIGVVYWRRTSAHSSTSKGFGRVHDTIACYGKTRAARWRLWRCRGEFTLGDPALGALRIEGMAEDHLNSSSSERVGYPTQKPVSLVSRFITSATLPGDVVLDPTCGSGTTLVAATSLGREGVGIDLSADAIAVARFRNRLPEPPVQGDLFGDAA